MKLKNLCLLGLFLVQNVFAQSPGPSSYPQIGSGTSFRTTGSPRLKGIGQLYYQVVNGIKIGHPEPLVLFVDWDKKTAQLISDPFVEHQKLPLVAELNQGFTSGMFCFFLKDATRGLTFPYCTFHFDDPNGVLQYADQRWNPIAEEQLTLKYMDPLPPLQADAKFGGLFQDTTRPDHFIRVDPILRVMNDIRPCHPEGERSFETYLISEPNGIGGGFKYSATYRYQATCTYADENNVNCWSVNYRRVTDASLPASCAKPAAPALITNPMQWKNSVVGPDGTIWSDSLGLFLNCANEWTPSQTHNFQLGRDYYDGCWYNTFTNHPYRGSLGYRGYVGQVENGNHLLQSDAALACEAIGGKLPTLEQFKTLTKDPYYWPKVSTSHLEPTRFWTSTLTVHPDYANAIQVYGTGVPSQANGPFELEFPFEGEVTKSLRGEANYVRCVNR